VNLSEGACPNCLYIHFEGILSRAQGNFEEHNKVLSLPQKLLITELLLLLLLLLLVVVVVVVVVVVAAVVVVVVQGC
jgi:hypothetical protein